MYIVTISYVSSEIMTKLRVNPIRSGGGALKAPPSIFCPHAFNFGATLLYVGDFSQKIV